MNTTTKQVTVLQSGEFSLELDEEKLQQLAATCAGAEQTLQNLTEEMEHLIYITDHFADIEGDAFQLLRTMCDVKKDYRMLMSLVTRRKEAGHE